MKNFQKSPPCHFKTKKNVTAATVVNHHMLQETVGAIGTTKPKKIHNDKMTENMIILLNPDNTEVRITTETEANRPMNEDIDLHQEAVIMINMIAIGRHQEIATTIDQIAIAEEKTMVKKTETTIKEVVTIAKTITMDEILINTETITVTEVTQEIVTTQQITSISPILIAIMVEATKYNNTTEEEVIHVTSETTKPNQFQ